MEIKTKKTFLKIWRYCLLMVFVFSTLHLIRDILQEILGVRNVFTEFGHFQADISRIPSMVRFLYIQPFSGFLTFPVEIFMIIAAPIAWKRKEFTKIDGIIIILIVFSLLWYIPAALFDSSKGLLIK